MKRNFLQPGAVWMAICGLLLPATGAIAGLPASGNGTADKAGVKRVLLVHGIYNSGNYMRNMKRLLVSKGWEVYAISLRPNDASISFEAMARQLDTFVKASIPDGAKFDLVGFSMGGLVCRYYVQKLHGYRRVRRLVTISTPNHGTLWAWLSGRAGVREMRPNSALLKELNSDAGTLTPLDYTSIYTPLDLTVLPPSSSRMAVARNVVSWVPLHALMVHMPGPLRAMAQALE